MCIAWHVVTWLRKFGLEDDYNLTYRPPILPLSFIFQLSELEQRVIEAESRAEDAEGKVRKANLSSLEYERKLSKKGHFRQFSMH